MRAPTQAVPQENQCNPAALLNELRTVYINDGRLTVKTNYGIDNSLMAYRDAPTSISRVGFDSQ